MDVHAVINIIGEIPINDDREYVNWALLLCFSLC